MSLMTWLFGKSIKPGELRRRMEAGEKFLVLDVRTEEEFRGPEGRIPGARLVPLKTVAARAADEVRGFEGGVITVCSHGLRSRVAQRALRKLGIESRSLAGGIKAWSAQGFEVVRETQPAGCAARAPGAKPC